MWSIRNAHNSVLLLSACQLLPFFVIILSSRQSNPYIATATAFIVYPTTSLTSITVHGGANRVIQSEQLDASSPKTGRVSVFQRYRSRKKKRSSKVDHENTFEILNEQEQRQYKHFLFDSLSNNTLCRHLPYYAMRMLVNGFELYQVKQGQTIVKQNDDSTDDYVYVVVNGNCTVYVDDKLVEGPYGILQEGSMFGELGVLYNTKRAATVMAGIPTSNNVTDTFDTEYTATTSTSSTNATVILYRISGIKFKRILNKPNHTIMELQEIDEAINQVWGTNALYGGSIIPPYQPYRFWLWRQIKGTIVTLSLKTTLVMVIATCIFVVYAKARVLSYQGITLQTMFTTNDFSWIIQKAPPDKSIPFIQGLSLIKTIWDYQKTLSTFVLTFFVGQAFSFWREMYSITRNIQTTLDNFLLILATNVERRKGSYDLNDNNNNGHESFAGQVMTDRSKALLEDVAQYTRLYHILVWASLTKRFSMLLTIQGLERMESRGIMTKQQLHILKELSETAAVPSQRLYYAPLEWMMIRANQAAADGYLTADAATKSHLLSDTRKLLDDSSSLETNQAGRMPKPYVHLVQILVDTLVFISPLALYTELGSLSIIAVGILTYFYTGLLSLAKIFLDPLNNEKYCDNTIYMDLGVLIRESNAGSILWELAGKETPF